MAQASSRGARHADPSGIGAPHAAATDPMLAPVIAGAFARGMAESFEVLGIAGLLLDGGGAILFASSAAQRFLQGAVRIQVGHLVAERGDHNQALGHFIAAAVIDGREPIALRLPGSSLTLRALARSDAMALPGQLVRAVVTLVEDAPASR